jgi:hypothetical protein
VPEKKCPAMRIARQDKVWLQHFFSVSFCCSHRGPQFNVVDQHPLNLTPTLSALSCPLLTAVGDSYKRTSARPLLFFDSILPAVLILRQCRRSQSAHNMRNGRSFRFYSIAVL